MSVIDKNKVDIISLEERRISLSDWINWIFAAIQVFIAVIVSIRTLSSEMSIFYVVILAFDTILCVVWIYHIKFVGRLKKQKHDMKDELLLAEKKIKDLSSCIEDAEEKAKKRERDRRIQIDNISKSIMNNSIHNNEVFVRIADETGESFDVLERTVKYDLKNEEKKMILDKSVNVLKTNLYYLFNRHCANVMQELCNLEESYIHLSGIDRRERIVTPISLSIKLFNKPYIIGEKRDEIKVYTAFRDKRSYDSRKREIAKVEYTIDGNTDFVHCLSNDYYRMNNKKRGDDDYNNEHEDFDRYYNSAIVCPIRVKTDKPVYRFYGYLCCDCMNYEDDIIFSEASARLLFSFAQSFATFIDAMETNWNERVADRDDCPKSYLEVLYNKMMKGEF